MPTADALNTLSNAEETVNELRAVYDRVPRRQIIKRRAAKKAWKHAFQDWWTWGDED